MRKDDDATLEPVLGGFAYLVLALLDLVTTTVLLRGFPHQAMEANGLLAGILAEHGFLGLWLVKFSGALLALGLYLVVRYGYTSPRVRGVADTALVATCTIQGAIVLVNILGFANLAVL